MEEKPLLKLSLKKVLVISRISDFLSIYANPKYPHLWRNHIYIFTTFTKTKFVLEDVKNFTLLTSLEGK